MTTALSVQNLMVSYDKKVALRDVSFQVKQGTLTGVIGPNGAGKSTLLKAMLGLIPKDQGTIQAEGKPLKKMRKNIAYVPQRNNIDWDFPINVRDTVLLGTYPKLGVFHRPSKADKQWAEECLEQVGLSEYKNKQIGQLSGGQQQRVFLARALAQQAQIFLLDEPFVGIDIKSEETIINILKDIRDSGKTVLVVHHDLSKAEKYFDDLILLNVELVEAGETEVVLTPDTLAKAYQSQLPFLQTEGASTS